MNKIKPKYIVFDFDGTIADSVDLQIRLYNKLAKREGYNQITVQNLIEFKNKSVKQAAQMAAIPIHKLPLVVNQIRKGLSNHFEEINLIDGISDVFLNLRKKYRLGILTSNSKDTVSKYLEKKKLINNFDFIYTALNILGKDKIIKKMLGRENLAKSDVLYVGDEVRDIKACKRCGLKIVAVSWGLNSRQLLAEYQPNYLINQPLQLLEIL